MSGQNITSYLLHYIKVHWFRISLVAFLLFLIFKKDFSFTINLNAPAPTETTLPPAKQPVQQEPPPKRETFTEQASQQSMTPAPEKGVLDRFDFSSIIGGSDRQLLERLNKLDSKVVEAYIKRFGRVARNEQKKFGIPASVILANALLHSQAGESILTAQANNHFGLLCTPDWRGDKWDGDGECLRAYENAWTSFRDHSFYITTGTFSDLRKLDPKDYKGWAKGLEKNKFSTADNFAEQLIEVIEQYGLQQMD
ncbi:MAG: glucosaminidase domain-containing protein [Saprospiraceae bacterium]|nr:glucosaminidase domain-containing protein [Lewinella sp.]